MGRCGCASGSCTCTIAGSDGISVTGTGSASNPYEVAVRLSRDAGNSATFGTDTGLFVPSGGDTPGSGGATVAGLPETGVLGGYRGAGSWVAIGNTIQAVQQGRDLPLDVMHLDVRGLSDRSAALAWPNAFPADQATLTAPITRYTRAEWQLWAPLVASADGDGRDTYWGWQWQPQWHADDHGGPTLGQALDVAAGKTVLVPQLHDDFVGPTVLRLVQRYGAGQSVIVAAPTVQRLSPFLDANIACAVVLNGQGDADNWPPDALVSNGITWVVADLSISDTALAGYVDAGLQVLAKRVNRHVERTRIEDLGLRGILSDDPIYASGRTELYQTGWPLQAGEDGGAVPYGLSQWQMDQDPDTALGALVRGRPNPGDPHAWLQLDAGQGAHDHALHAGWMCPLRDDVDQYDITGWIRFASRPNSHDRWLGLSVCNPTDQAWDQDEALPMSTHAYLIVYRFGGEVQIYHLGLDGDVNKPTGRWLPSGQAAELLQPYAVTVRVTPDTVQALDPDSGDVLVDCPNTATADENPRGLYVTLNKRESEGDTFDGDFGDFETVYSAGRQP